MKNRLIQPLRRELPVLNDGSVVEHQDNTVFMSIALGTTAATVLIFFAYLIWSMI